MPIYEYNGGDCRREVEALVRNGSQPACPQCGSVHLNIGLSVFAAHASGARTAAPPAPCGSCGHPGVPGRCALK